jgi:hypothetical protein
MSIRPKYLSVQRSDSERVGFIEAGVLALVRYATSLPGEANGRVEIDGETWWQVTYPEIGDALGGVSRKTVMRIVHKLEADGELLSRQPDAWDGTQTKAYQIPLTCNVPNGTRPPPQVPNGTDPVPNGTRPPPQVPNGTDPVPNGTRPSPKRDRPESQTGLSSLSEELEEPEELDYPRSQANTGPHIEEEIEAQTLTGPFCSIPGCTRPSSPLNFVEYFGNLCDDHYERVRPT